MLLYRSFTAIVREKRETTWLHHATTTVYSLFYLILNITKDGHVQHLCVARGVVSYTSVTSFGPKQRRRLALWFDFLSLACADTSAASGAMPIALPSNGSGQMPAGGSPKIIAERVLDSKLSLNGRRHRVT